MTNQGLGLWIERRRTRTPDALAMIDDDTSFTYGEFARMVDACASHLRAHGVARSDRVAYVGENSPQFLATLFACATMGAVFVPVNTRLAAPEIAHVLTDSGAAVLIQDEPAGTPWREGAAAAGLDDIMSATVATTPHPDLPALTDLPGLTLDHPAAIIYTSGTTGRAKGAVLSHGNLTWVAMNCIVDYDVNAQDVALMVSPLFHVASLGMGALPVLLKGGALILERGFDAQRALRLIEQHGATMVSGVPTTFQLLAQHPTWASTDLSSLKKLTCGGSPAPLSLIEEYESRGLRFSQGYGMTEASPSVTALAPHVTRAKQGSVGLPHFFTHVRIAGEDDQPVEAGTVGEVQITGPNVFAGYWQRPDDDADAFTADGWFRSGDLGYLDEDGFLYIAGRSKDMIISGGENIYPAEIESVLSDMEQIATVAVVGFPDERWGEVPWAVVTTSDGAPVTTSDVQTYLQGKVARYKIPKRVVVVDALPVTATGKVRKHEVRALLEALPEDV